MRKFIRTLIEYWYIWFGIASLFFLLIFTIFQLGLSKRLREYRFTIWPRIFLVVIPPFVILWAISVMIPDLFLSSSLLNYFGENAEDIARQIERVISYIGGVVIAFLLARCRKKHLPLQKIEFIDNTLDKIFGKAERGTDSGEHDKD